MTLMGRRSNNNSPPAKMPAMPVEPAVPFAPIERRHGEEYARAAQYVADLQSKLDLVQTDNSNLQARLQLLEGANERLHEENERIIKQAKVREDDLVARYDSMLARNVNVHTKIEIVARILVELIEKDSVPDREGTMKEVEKAFASLLEQPSK
jgi:hypothetical protein